MITGSINENSEHSCSGCGYVYAGFGRIKTFGMLEGADDLT